ncbi:MAG: hydroxymethylbilane synthase [Bacteroidetes bacterium]|nr:hydroxymethylbilane synthase [Bacteroidota bacterium]
MDNNLEETKIESLPLEKPKRGPIIIGSRGSDLALWQANHILRKLQKLNLEAEVKIIKTQGDIIQDVSLDKLEGKGFFTKELEEALIKKEIDLAVHSHKDLPTTSPEGLKIAAVSDREDPAELILIRKESIDVTQKFSFKKNAIFGTSSARRKSQLLAFRNDIKIEDLRGNVPTRVQKLRDKKYDAIMLAAAGVERLRLNLSEFKVIRLDPKEFIPAPAQGVLAMQIREDDHELFEFINKLNSEKVEDIIGIERKVLNLFDGGCSLPLGIYCIKEENKFKVWTSKSEKWNTMPKRLYFESFTDQGFAEKIVNSLKAIKPLSVLITCDLKEDSFFKNVLEGNGYKVQGISFIETKKVSINTVPHTDWVFFASSNAVEHFFIQNPTLKPKTKFGVIGKTTELELKKYNRNAAFVGSINDTKVVGKKFAKAVGAETVLFPQAKGGLRTIQQQFEDTSKLTDLVVYETVKKENATLPEVNVIVFTSPSNVLSFFEKNKISKTQKVIAIGKSTEKKLKEFGIENCILPASFDEVGLSEAVFGIN